MKTTLLLFSAIFLATVFIEYNSDSIWLGAQYTLSSPWLNRVAFAYVIGTVVVHHILVGRKNSSTSAGALFQHFGSYADAIGNIVTLAGASTTSLALIRGVVMQWKFNQPAFIGLANYDLAAVLLVSTYLLIYSAQLSTKLLIATINTSRGLTPQLVSNEIAPQRTEDAPPDDVTKNKEDLKARDKAHLAPQN
jgi:hypothetical protein